MGISKGKHKGNFCRSSNYPTWHFGIWISKHPNTRTHTRVPKFIGNNVANFLRIHGEMEDEGGIGTVLTHNEGADFVIDELIVW